MNQIKSLILISFIAIFSNTGAQTWNQLGGTVFTGSSSSELDMQISRSDQVYVAGKNSSVNDDHYVYTYVNGSGWQQVGSSISNNGGGTRMAPFSLYIDPGNSNIYLAYVDYGSLQIYVSMFSGGVWSNIGGPVYTISGTDPIYEIELTSNGNGGLALAFIEAQGGNYNVHHYEYNGASWNFMSDVISSLNLENDLDLELDPTTNKLVASFVLNTGGGNGDVRVYQYSGGSWNPLATGNWNGSHAAMDVDTTNGDIYISYIQMNPPQYVYVNKYSSTTFIWSTVGGSGGQVSTQNASGVDLMVMNNNPVISLVDQSDLQSYVYEYSTAWNLISPTPSSGGLENTTNNHGTPVLAYDSYGSYYVSSNDLTAPGTASVYRKCTAPVISVSTQDVTCNGGSNGAISISGSGGVSPYQFSIDGGTTLDPNANFGNLAAGSYIAYVEDANGCSATQTVSINEPAAVSVGLMSYSNASCNGVCDGSLSLGASGVSPYTFSIDGSNYQTSNSFSNMCAGSYTYYAQDANGCIGSSTLYISEPSVLTIGTSVTNVSCNGACDGSITASGSGGTPPYSYSWNGGATTATINNLCPGNDTCTITDANGCTASKIITITEPAPMSLSVASINNVTCNGACDGSASINASGSFSWSNGSNTPGINNVCAGYYLCTVTDGTGCSDTISVTITEPATALVPSQTVTNVSCNGGSDGSVTFSGSGGIPPYTYSFNNGIFNTPNVFTGISAGSYNAYIQDANSCIVPMSVTITEPAALLLDETNVSVTNASCANNDGSITGITVSGGTIPYSYTYNSVSTSGIDFTGAPGTYTLTVTDSNLCAVTSSQYTIGATNSNVVVSLTPTNVTCNGQCNGSISSSVSGGTAPYTYAWGNGNTSPSPTGVCAGNYTVTVTDANQCTGSAATTVTQPNPMTITVSTTLPTCGANDGSATVTGVTGGSAPYSYLWSSGSFVATADSLTSGVYTVTVTDNNGCTAIKTVNLSSSSAPSITSTLNSPTCHGDADGSINLTISGGTAPYTYDWSTGEHTNNISNLPGGTYDVTISDASGCSVSETFFLPDTTAIDLTNYSVTDASCGGNDGSIAVTVSGGAGGYTYLWSSGGTSSADSNLVSGTYNLSVSDANGCLAQKSYTVSNAGGPVITVDQINEPTCQSGTGDILVTVTGGSAPYTYSWSNGATSEDLYNVSAGNYELTVTDNVGCQGVEYAELVGVNTSTTPICMVTVDLNTGTNVVVWPKVSGQGIAYYEVFKETSVINNFQSIATVPFDSISQFVDTAANPQIHSYRYNLRTIDSCGNYSEFLTIHKTIHLSTNIGLNNVINLAWDDYVGFPYNTFYIDRYHSTTGWVTIDSVPANVHSFTDNNYPGLNSLEYSIEVKPADPCIAQKQQSHNTTRSNRAILAGGSSGTGIEEKLLNQVEVYPNPFNELLTVFVDTENWSYSIIDITGKLIRNGKSNQTQQELDLSKLENGVYLIQLKIGDYTITKKLIKE